MEAVKSDTSRGREREMYQTAISRLKHYREDG
jgi:hypothetical protein